MAPVPFCSMVLLDLGAEVVSVQRVSSTAGDDEAMADVTGGIRTLPAQWDRARLPELTAVFRIRTRDQWCGLLEHAPVCVTPVLDMLEAPVHPHDAHRNGFFSAGGGPVPSPAPRFGRTPVRPGAPGRAVGADTADVLAGFGFDDGEIDRLRDAGVIATP